MAAKGGNMESRLIHLISEKELEFKKKWKKELNAMNEDMNVWVLGKKFF